MCAGMSLAGYGDTVVSSVGVLYVLYVYKLCWKIVACSERDMAYATILVRFVYFMWC